MNAHISNIARTCYFAHCGLASIRWFLTCAATVTPLLAFVLSRIDLCNTLLFASTHNVTSHVQRIQNYADAEFVFLPMSSKIAIYFISFHWLSVNVRSTCKIVCLCYHCNCSTAPSYVTDKLQKSRLSLATHHPAQTPCLYSIAMHTVRHNLVIARFGLHHCLPGTPLQMMSCEPDQYYHICLVPVPFRLRKLHFLFDHCAYVHGLALLFFGWRIKKKH